MPSDLKCPATGPPVKWLDEHGVSLKCSACKEIEIRGTRGNKNHSRACMERYENWIRSELNLARGSKPSDSEPKGEQEVKRKGSGREVSDLGGSESVPVSRQGALDSFEELDPLAFDPQDDVLTGPTAELKIEPKVESQEPVDVNLGGGEGGTSQAGSSSQSGGVSRPDSLGSYSKASVEAATMHGLLNYAAGFVVGRCLKPSARQFGHLQSGSSDTELTSRLCNDTCKIISRMRPREIRSLSSDRPAVIYTDGAYENGNGTWGAVVIIPQLGINAIHWGTVGPVLMEHWTSLGLQQKICRIELVAVLLVRFFYRKELSNSSALYFIDNEAARYCLIKGSSPSLSMYNICCAVSLVEAEYPSASWYERVASEPNIADGHPVPN